MKFWARNHGKGRGPMWICLGLMLAHADALAANDAPAIAAKDEPPCLSLKEVHDGYPRYRIVEGRRCWYASTRGRKPNPQRSTSIRTVIPFGTSRTRALLRRRP